MRGCARDADRGRAKSLAAAADAEVAATEARTARRAARAVAYKATHVPRLGTAAYKPAATEFKLAEELPGSLRLATVQMRALFRLATGAAGAQLLMESGNVSVGLLALRSSRRSRAVLPLPPSFP